jgi:hypothetical protein
MGRLRPKQLYITRARIFRDSPIEYTIRWFTVPDGTPFHPDAHRWAGRPWRYDPYQPTIGPGELTLTPLRYTPNFPPNENLPLLGSPDWWANGVPVSALETGTDMVRPGVCPPKSCYVPADPCDQCPEMPRVWRIDPRGLPAELKPELLWQGEGCTFTSGCYTGCPVLPRPTAAVWYLQPEVVIPTLSPAVLLPSQPCGFTSCCDQYQ